MVFISKSSNVSHFVAKHQADAPLWRVFSIFNTPFLIGTEVEF